MPKYGRGQYIVEPRDGMHISLKNLEEFFRTQSPYGGKKHELEQQGRRTISLDVPVNLREDRARDHTKRLYIDELPDSVIISYQWSTYRSNENYRRAVEYVKSKILQPSGRDELESRNKRRKVRLVVNNE